MRSPGVAPDLFIQDSGFGVQNEKLLFKRFKQSKRFKQFKQRDVFFVSFVPS